MDFILAFSAGLLSFLSPCILPLIPVYLSYIAGSSIAEVNTIKAKKIVWLRSVFFITGFSIIFILLGISVSSISKLLTEHLKLIQQIGGILIIILGLHMIGLFKIKILYSEKKFIPSSASNEKSIINSILLGMAFAAGWTPCVGPILASILIYAGSMDTIGKGVMLLVFYSSGLAVPFLLSAILIGNLTNYLKRLYKYLPVISVVSGIILVIMGILEFTDRLEVITQYFGSFNI